MAAKFELSLVDKVSGAASKITANTNKVTEGMKSLKSAAADVTPMSKAVNVVSDSCKDMAKEALPSNRAIATMTKALAQLGPIGIGVAAALVVMTVSIMATVGALYAMAKAAVSVIQQRNALAETLGALGGGKQAGEATLLILDQLSRELPFTTQKMGEWAKSFQQANLQGEGLRRAVKATAAATALMGESGASAARSMIEDLNKNRIAALQMLSSVKMQTPEAVAQLRQMGLQITDLTAELGVTPMQFRTMRIGAGQLGIALEHALMRKGAGAIKNMASSMEAITEKVREGISSLFEGLEGPVGELMHAVQQLFSEFYRGSNTMAHGKSMITAVMTSMLKTAAHVVTGIHKGFLMVQIAALKVAIAIAPIVLVLKKVFTNSIILLGLKSILVMLAMAAAAIVAPFVLLSAAVVGIVTAVVVVVTALQAAVYGAFVWLVGAVVDGIPTLIDILGEWASSAANSAAAWVTGLVDGIVGGLGKIVGAVKNVAEGALTAFTDYFKIKSPSRLMMQMGGYVAEGAAMGIEGKSGRVEQAASMMSSDAGDAAMRRGSGARSTGNTMTLHFADGAFRIDGAGKGAMSITKEMVALVFEEMAAAQGLVIAT